jgi:hypothetical protein
VEKDKYSTGAVWPSLLLHLTVGPWLSKLVVHRKYHQQSKQVNAAFNSPAMMSLDPSGVGLSQTPAGLLVGLRTINYKGSMNI